jgi:ATP synthase protein I
MAKAEDPFYKGLSYASRIGVELVVATLVGTGLGFLADGYFKTSPWFLGAGIILGGAAGILNIFRFVKTLQKEEEEQEQKIEKK